MTRLMQNFSVMLALILLPGIGVKADDGSIVAWKRDVRIAPVSTVTGRHTIHTYYLANPESPDGRRVLFFASAHPAGYVGDIVVLDRATGKETVLASGIHTEDAHRAACQQWISDGRRVAFHEVIEKRWRVVAVDLEMGTKTVIAEDHQVGIGQPQSDLLPVYGCHWNPGSFRDLEVWDASTGKLTTAARIGEVEARYGDWLHKEFRSKPVSVFFPVLSPDETRVFFKIAAGNGGDNFMAKNASLRQGLVCYDLNRHAITWMREQWGHPAWFPDSQHIIEMGNIVFDTGTGTNTRIPGVPKLRGSHPSVSPDGKLMVTDGLSEPAGGKPNEWGIVVGDLHSGEWALLHSFDQTKGAKSWRRNDPHPVFSADGKRIYFNTSDSQFTRLHVAEWK